MVGTSIFENYFKKMQNVKTLYDNIKGKSYTFEYEDYKNQAEKIKNEILKFYKDNYKDDISAEIKSINKIKAYLKQDLQICLLASDTINSYIASKILEELLIEKGFDTYFNDKLDVIKDLQVEDRDRFINDGLSNLIQRIENIAIGNIIGNVVNSNYVSDLNSEGCYNNVIFNISGGYKATIPYLTMIAQINGSNLYYIFEETEELITIPPMPITINMELFDEFNKEFKMLEKGIDNYNKWKQYNFSFVQKAGSCIQTIDNYALLSPLGEILWRNYKAKHANFFTTEEVLEKIKNNEILIDKVIKCINEETRHSKTEKKGVGKNKYFVYDDGNNDYRIFYFEKEGDLYIYEIFDDEEKQIKYLNDNTKSKKDYNPDIYCSIDKTTKKIII